MTRSRSLVTINTRPVAQNYSDEKIIEYSSPSGGGLIAFVLRDGRLRVEPYRHDDTVDIVPPLLPRPTLADLLATARDALHDADRLTGPGTLGEAAVRDLLRRVNEVIDGASDNDPDDDEDDDEDEDDVRGCSCGMADYGTPGHDGGPPADSDTITLDGMWVCPGGCGRHIAEVDADMIVDHVRDCDGVDGTGNALVASKRVVNEFEHGTRAVAGTLVRITELVWNDGGRSFEVHLAGRITEAALGDQHDTDLTQDGCFDVMPTDAQIAALLTAAQNDEDGNAS
jgi:hypothetical protein